MSVVAVIAAIFLSTVQRQIGGVQVGHDLRRNLRKALDEQFEQQLVSRAYRQ